VSDTHIGSKFQQITSLKSFYKHADAKGVAAYLHAGDLLEGIHQAHRDAAYEQYAFGVDAQVNAVVKQYPKSNNGETLHIAGNHDDWAFQNVGVTSGAMIEAKRPDMKYLGYHSAFVELGNMRFLIQHGSKGGSTYAKSYKAQKLIEGLADNERTQTDVAMFGHYHQDAYLGRYMGVFSFMLPCFKAQDRFLRMLGKNPTIGGLILEIETDRDRRIWNLKQEWVYFDPVLNDYPGATE
jgi:predicted phosphodiesterase